MPDPLVYLNGEFVPYVDARVGVEDRAVQFGDGVYEVVRYYGGRPFRMGEHMARLERSAAGIELPIPPTVDLAAADEIFLTSTKGELRPVIELDGRPVGTGAVDPAFERALQLFDAAARQF